MGYKRVQKLSSFRKIALSFWSAPREGTILGSSPVDATECLKYLDKLYLESKKRVSVATLFGRGLAIAFQETPAFNAKMIWGTLYQKDSVDVFYHVDLGRGKDLAGVVVRDVAHKAPLQIAQELEDQRAQLRRGQNKQYENTQKGLLSYLPVFLIGFLMRLLLFLEYNLGLDLSFLGAEQDAFGTVMVTDVALFDIHTAYAPLPSPTRVPAVGLVTGIRYEPVVIDGQIVARPIFRLCVTFDHRFGDGAQIGRIQNRLLDYFSKPQDYEDRLAAGKSLPRLPRPKRGHRPPRPQLGEYRDDNGVIQIRDDFVRDEEKEASGLI